MGQTAGSTKAPEASAMRQAFLDRESASAGCMLVVGVCGEIQISGALLPDSVQCQ